MTTARGLTNFISDIRNCNNVEAEQKRVEKEMANIRQKFTGSSNLNAYQKKKYCWKLVYMFMLGYEVDFGHMEVIQLISSPKFTEKNTGYVATTILLKSSDELMTLVINSIRNDLVSEINWSQTLALSAIANIGGAELAEALSSDVQRLLVAHNTSAIARKKAALCLLRLYRQCPHIMVPSEWAPRVISLLEDRHLGVVTSVVSLILGLVSEDPGAFADVVPASIMLLSRLVMHKACGADYLYYATPSPWLQVKLLRLLQYFPAPEAGAQRGRLNESLRKILTKTDVTKIVNKNNADHAILFEAVNLLIHQGDAADEKLSQQVHALLGRFISVREPNIRYLGLETMGRLAHLAHVRDMPGTIEAIKKHQSTVLYSLKDADVSVRRRALELLFSMCDTDNAVEIVRELMNFLAVADMQMREQMVLKIAIIAERFTTDLRWYVDTILNLVTIAGSYVSDDIWHRAVQIVTNNEALQKYAAQTMFVSLEPARVHETTVKVGGYVLGEFGYLIGEDEGTSGEEQFAVLQKHIVAVSPPTRALLLTSMVKMANLYDGVKPLARPVFAKYQVALDPELQQRAVEYLALPTVEGEVMHTVLDAMPPWPEDRENALEARLKSQKEETQDRNVWVNKNAPERGSDDDDDEGEYEPRAAAGGGGSGGAVTEESVTDLLGMSHGDTSGDASAATADDGDTAARTANGTEISLTAALIPKMQSWFKGLVVSPQAVLFETEQLQIGLKHEYRGSQGRVVLFYGNKTDETLSNFRAEVKEVPYLRSQAQPAPAELGPKQQVQQQIMCEAMQPYADAPPIEFGFVDGSGAVHKYPMRLPIVASCFCEPLELEQDVFMQRWRALEGEGREQRDTFQAPGDIDASAVKNMITTGLHLGIAKGVDTSDASITAAGTFRTGAPAQGGAGKVSVGLLMRLEINAAAKAYRCTVRAVHGKVSEAIFNILRNQLAAN